ncbi:MAG: hypothetical protein JOZ69_25005 [Myxococcales bacterium]|nr:hypothetical protein [Myxococcales bacterium]
MTTASGERSGRTRTVPVYTRVMPRTHASCWMYWYRLPVSVGARSAVVAFPMP